MDGDKVNEDPHAIVEYASHVEKRNGELVDAIQKVEDERRTYRDALARIAVHCKGCPASDIASEALEKYEDVVI
jgi:hypothetical protein